MASASCIVGPFAPSAMIFALTLLAFAVVIWFSSAAGMRMSQSYSMIDDWSGFGQRTTGSGSVVFTGVPLAEEDVVPFQSAFERPTTVGPFAQLLHAAIDTGIARGAYEDLLQFVRHKARPWIDAGVERAAEDPLTQQEIGKLRVRLAATEKLLQRAGEFVDRAQAEPDEASVAAASIAVAEARAISTETSLLLGSKPPCEIYVDGKATGLHTPQPKMTLAAGKHKITLVNNEFGIKETFTVDIKPDATEKQIKDYSDRLPK